MVNHICAHAKKHRMFRELCKDIEANFTKLLIHTDEANPMAVKCQDVLWLAKLSYKASIFDHLNKLNISQQGKGGDIFTDSENDQLTSSMWMLNPFADEGTDHCDALLELRADYSQKAVFKTFSHPMDFWVTLLDIAEYKDLAEQAIDIFVQMPTSYICLSQGSLV
ncbi:protein FAM200B-like [Procambarus clarkii]|uniref:protein FAM200B-like n=1 Tax=Procambarus clarkii TaxID=6728 RepID=UPI003741ED71